MGLCRGLIVLSWLFLCVASVAGQESAPAPAPPASLSISEYIAALDHLASTVKQLAKPEDLPDLLNSIPPVWRIQTEQRTFEVPSEWLRHDLSEWQKKPSQEIQKRIFARLQTIRSEAASFQAPPADVSARRARLNGILAAPEFQNIHGPTWLDRLKQRASLLLIKLLSRVFRSSAIPTISNVIVYGLIGLAMLVLTYWMYRTIRNSAELETIFPNALPVSSKEWKVWIAEARAAADAGNWRDAIHRSYWCGISFLEARGMWRPDAARTPREYLRLISSASEQRETLSTLTRRFELIWYGTQPADARTFSDTLAQLEKLGCQLN